MDIDSLRALSKGGRKPSFISDSKSASYLKGKGVLARGRERVCRDGEGHRISSVLAVAGKGFVELGESHAFP